MTFKMQPYIGRWRNVVIRNNSQAITLKWRSPLNDEPVRLKAAPDEHSLVQLEDHHGSDGHDYRWWDANAEQAKRDFEFYREHPLWPENEAPWLSDARSPSLLDEVQTPNLDLLLVQVNAAKRSAAKRGDTGTVERLSAYLAWLKGARKHLHDVRSTKAKAVDNRRIMESANSRRPGVESPLPKIGGD